MKQKILFVFGTRPEAIKIAPLYLKFKKLKDFDIKVCVTGQHRQMLDQVLEFFNIVPDYDLNLMKPNQSIFDITADILKNIEQVLNASKPDIVVVQGDTTTAFAGALAAFYKKIKIAHVEAGLRSRNKYAPFPEEINRILIGHIADYHFAPTELARKNLEQEGITKNVWVTGNTVIDALLYGLEKINSEIKLRRKIEAFFEKLIGDYNNSKIILVTSHRRESFGEGLENISNAIKEVALKYKDVKIIYPVHLNPNVRKQVNKILNGLENVFLIEPLEYPYLIWLLSKSYIILTDSGGIQEEAPALGKPVLVMRDVTERIEGIEAGTAKLVGTKKDRIVEEVERLLFDENEYRKMANAVNPYGDGKASERIAQILLNLKKEELYV